MWMHLVIGMRFMRYPEGTESLAEDRGCMVFLAHHPISVGHDLAWDGGWHKGNRILQSIMPISTAEFLSQRRNCWAYPPDTVSVIAAARRYSRIFVPRLGSHLLIVAGYLLRIVIDVEDIVLSSGLDTQIIQHPENLCAMIRPMIHHM
jgi:hypothetical protein